MKRAATAASPQLCEHHAGRAFFALEESTDLLLHSCDGDPRLVALLLQLSCAHRVAVWLWLADPVATMTYEPRHERHFWHQALLRRLCEEVPTERLARQHDWDLNRNMFRPILWSPCKHWANNTLYPGLYNCAYQLASDSASGEEDEEKEEVSYGDFDGCNQLVAQESYWHATWQPVCCAEQSALHWDFVASALLHRHTALAAFYAQMRRQLIVQYNESKYWRRYLFSGPPYHP